MSKTHRLFGLWVLVVTISIVAQPNRELSATPGPGAPPECKQCTCKVAKTWKKGFEYWGLRRLNEDNTYTAVDHMYINGPGTGGQVPTSWAAACGAGVPTLQTVPGTNGLIALKYTAFEYLSATPDCTYGGTDAPLIACSEGTSPTNLGNLVQQVLCQ